MIRIFFFFVSIFSACQLFSQSTKVTVFDIDSVYEGLEVFNPHQISVEGNYSNQPFFISNDELLLSAERNGQTDVLKYNFKTNKKEFLTQTDGSEYSPQPIPKTSKIAAVRLEKNGLQRFYQYDLENKKSSILIENIAVAYFRFIDSKKVLATILNDQVMDLVSINLNSAEIDTLFTDAGRGIEKIPNSKQVSYTLKNKIGRWDLYGMSEVYKNSYFITELPNGVQDYVWINENQILIGVDNKLFIFDTFGESHWVHAGSLKSYGIKNISRLAISPDGKKLAIVSE